MDNLGNKILDRYSTPSLQVVTKEVNFSTISNTLCGRETMTKKIPTLLALHCPNFGSESLSSN